jgi:hypothetical protein
MSTDINTIKSQLQKNFKNQRTPSTYTDDDYLDLAIEGCKKFYVDVGLEDNWDSEFSVDSLSRTLDITQLRYCTVAAEIAFIDSIRTYWNTLISYTTNALKIANADKPFKAFSEMRKEKERELIDLFHRMTDTSNSTVSTSIDIDPVDFTFSES